MGDGLDLLAEDRGLLLAQARDAARLAAIDAPNIDAFGLVIDLKQYTPTKQVDPMIQRNGSRRCARRARRARRSCTTSTSTSRA